jgi:hypothetical protein
MIEHVAACPCGRDGDLEVFLDAILADVFVEAARPQLNSNPESSSVRWPSNISVCPSTTHPGGFQTRLLQS